MLYMVIEDFKGDHMECDDDDLIQQWMDQWKDIVDFHVIPVVTSAEAAAAIAPRL